MKMSSVFLFGVGKGHLSKRACYLARRKGAEVVNTIEPQCQCGHGCAPFKCNSAKKHWMEANNRGNPFDQRLEQAVMDSIRTSGTKKDKELLG
jgi:hypothetical protein